jgi:hypothetical protein
MTRYGFCFHPVLHREDCSGFLTLWFSDDSGGMRFFSTTYDIRYDEWDPVAGWIVMPKDADATRLRQLRRYAGSMLADLDRLQKMTNAAKAAKAAKTKAAMVADAVRTGKVAGRINA